MELQQAVQKVEPSAAAKGLSFQVTWALSASASRAAAGMAWSCEGMPPGIRNRTRMAAGSGRRVAG